MGKYLFFDIDGTLAGASRRITERTRWAVRNAREKGHKVFVCTGRVPASIVGDVTELEVDGVVSGAGSFVEIGGRYIYEHYLEPELVRQVMELFEENGLLFTLETRDAIYQTPGAREFFETRTMERIRDNPELMRYHEQVTKGQNLKPVAEFDIARTPVAKMCYIAMERKQIEACLPFLKQYFNVIVFSKSSDPFVNGEIILKDCTKGDGLRRVVDYFQGTMEESVGFGDSMNDYQMLEAAGVGVAYEEAPEEIKALAQYYFKEPDQDGIYDVMVRMGLADEMESRREEKRA